MTSAQRVAYRIRWLILIAAGAMGLLYLWFLFHFWPLHEWLDGDYGTSIIGTPLMLLPNALEGFGNCFLVLGLLLVLQWLFLRPSRGWTIRMARKARPMRTSVIAAGFMAMLLTAGLIAALMELPNWYAPMLDGPWPGAFAGVWLAMAVIWGAWVAVFWVYWRQGDRYTQMSRMIRGLVAGSVLEMIIAAPIQAANLHEDDCYCARGSYTGLVFGGTVLVWCFGPGVVLLFMRERYRRAALLGKVCGHCGYDLRGTLGVSDTCPECGAPIGDAHGYHAPPDSPPREPKE